MVVKCLHWFSASLRRKFGPHKRPDYFPPAGAWLLFASVTIGKVKKKVEPLLTPSDSTHQKYIVEMNLFLYSTRLYLRGSVAFFS